MLYFPLTLFYISFIPPFNSYNDFVYCFYFVYLCMLFCYVFFLFVRQFELHVSYESCYKNYIYYYFIIKVLLLCNKSIWLPLN